MVQGAAFWLGLLVFSAAAPGVSTSVCGTGLDTQGSWGRSDQGLAFGITSTRDVFVSGLETLLYTSAPGQGDSAREAPCPLSPASYAPERKKSWNGEA